MSADLLAGARWRCCATPPGALPGPEELARHPGPFLDAPVPGTTAGALTRSAPKVELDPDEWDWWYRVEFPGQAGGPWLLEAHGLATVADVWLNGGHRLHSENMFVRHALEVAALEARNELVLRFAALTPLLETRRPRPRWKTMGARHQGLRWYRTTLLGRQPGYVEVPPPVGPWRAVTLRRDDAPRVSRRRVVARCDGRGGQVDIELELERCPVTSGRARLHVGEEASPLELTATGEDRATARGSLALGGVARWWPHTHGQQPLYPLSIEADNRLLDLGAVGFRTVELDRGDGGFQFVVNGVPVFCRGAAWWPLDSASVAGSDAALDHTLGLARRAHMNMLRVPGGTAYEDHRFWDRCDALGILVWQDAMFGYLDPPDEEGFTALVRDELEQVFGDLGGRPSLAVVCGGQQIEEQAAFFGLPRERRTFPLIDDHIPALVESALPGVPYVTSSPTGGDLPFEADAGDCHYWGVGSLLRGLDDPRRCGLRFMSEGLGLATPPDPETVDEAFGGPAAAGHAPAWKRAVYHDTNRSWDLDDVRDHYTTELFRLDPRQLRYLDPGRALDVGRATNAELVRSVLSELRRHGSTCAGALLVGLRDLVPGPGWGVVDAAGRPKATWFVARRAFAPVAVLITDEGINGLRFHVAVDGDGEWRGTLRVELFGAGVPRPQWTTEQVLVVPAPGTTSVGSSEIFDQFLDVGYAYRYGPTGFDAVMATVLDGEGATLAQEVHLPMGQHRPLEPDVGLAAPLSPTSCDAWTVTVTSARLAQWVWFDVPGYVAEDSWFHLVPGHPRTVTLWPEPDQARRPAAPEGRVRAVNAEASAPVRVES